MMANAPWRSPLTLGLCLAFSLSVIDIAIEMFTGAPDVRNLPAALGAGVVAVIVVFLALWFMMRVFGATPDVSAGVASAASVLAELAIDLTNPGAQFVSTACRATVFVCAPNLFKVAFLLFALVPLVAVAAVSIITGARSNDLGDALTAGVPLLLAEAATFEWVYLYSRPDPYSPVKGLRYAALALLVLSATLILIWRSEKARAVVRNLTTVLAVLLVAALPWTATLPTARRSVPKALSRATSKPAAVPHVVLISIDALRADLASAADGYARMPNVGRFAQRAATFERAVAPSSWTLPSVGSWLTGVSPATHRLGLNARLSSRFVTLPEYMQDAGYRTAAIVGNHLLDTPTNVSRGFDDFVVLPRPIEPAVRFLSLGSRLVQQLRPPPGPADGQTALLTDRAVSWLTTFSSQPTFLWLHYFDPHGPYAAPADYLRPHPTQVEKQKGPWAAESDWPDDPPLARENYAAAASYVDANVGRLLRSLEELHLYEDALIVITADHGEELGEHGRWGHDRTLYSESIHVPLIIKLPRASRIVVHSLVSTQDMYPTILDECGIDFDHNHLESSSLTSLARGGSDSEDSQRVASWLIGQGEGKVAVFWDRFKYIGSEVTGREELFDTSTDPGDQASLAFARPMDLDRARVIVQAKRYRVQELRKHYGTTQIEQLDDEVRRRLQGLGYVR